MKRTTSMMWSYRLTYSLIVLVLLALVHPVLGWAAGPALPGTPAAVPGEILVGIRSNTKFAQVTNMLGPDVESRTLIQGADLTVSLLTLPVGRDAFALMQLQDDPAVVFAEPNGLMEGAWTPNDPYYNDPNKVYAPQQIKADQAWDLVRGSGDVVVAVVDSGVDFSHPDLNGTIWTNPREVPGNGLDDDGNGYVDDVNGWDFVNNDNLPVDDLGHGTHVTGILAAQTNNGIGIAGIAGGVKVLPVKVLNSDNQGTWADIAQGIIYATDQGVRAINLSLGGTASSETLSQAVQYAQNHGVLVIAAAGNYASNQAFYPAAYDGVVGVAATEPGSTHWSLSNYGSYIDLAAPGSVVYSTYWDESHGGSTYQFLSGTSMAAPVVTGVAALLWSLDPTLTASAMANTLAQSASDLGDPGWDPYYGNGQIDAYAAALMVQSNLPANGVIGGTVWVDSNGDGEHQLDENTGISDVPVHLRSVSSSYVAETTTDENGDYVFTGLVPGGYTVETVGPEGYVNTTPSTLDIIVGYAQATQTDFGFVAPTVVYLQSFEIVSGEDRLLLTWELSGAVPASGWDVLRSESGDLASAERINSQPVLGTPDGSGGATYHFGDARVALGHVYWYWLRNTATGDIFGPKQGTVPAAGGDASCMSVLFIPFVAH